MTQSKRRRPSSSNFRRFWQLEPAVAFLNHGSFGACPKPILELQADLRRRMEMEPVQFLWRRYDERIEPNRVAVAQFVGASPKDVVFVGNATTGVNAVVRSVKLGRGDELLSTDHAYNACQNALAQAAGCSGARLRVAALPFPLSGEEEIVEAILACVTRRTRLAMIDHVTSNSALVLPVARLIRELEKRGVDTLVDGAHAPGMVPVNLGELNPAYYTGNLHKWVCAPKGAAFLWARPDRQAGLQPAVVSHGNNTSRPGYTAFQNRFDWAGTSDPTAWLCAGAAIAWLGERLPGGWPQLRQRNHELAVEARRLLCRELRVDPPCPEDLLGAMATLHLPREFQNSPRTAKIDPEQLRLYDQFGIEAPLCRIGRPELRCLRISAQLYNTLPDYARLAEALKAIAAPRG